MLPLRSAIAIRHWRHRESSALYPPYGYYSSMLELVENSRLQSRKALAACKGHLGLDKRWRHLRQQDLHDAAFGFGCGAHHAAPDQDGA